MFDSSLFSLFTAGLACLVPLTAAYTKTVGDTPVGNPFSQPGLNENVPVGQPYTIKWQPTTQGSVTLVLLKGPSTNAVPLKPIVEHIPNTGSFIWTPSTDLSPSDQPGQGYGILLIDDGTGQFQYTTQFGISNPNQGQKSSTPNPQQPSTATTANMPPGKTTEKTPADLPVSNMPVSNMPVSNMPVSNMPVSNMPVSNMPVSAQGTATTTSPGPAVANSGNDKGATCTPKVNNGVPTTSTYGSHSQPPLSTSVPYRPSYPVRGNETTPHPPYGTNTPQIVTPYTGSAATVATSFSGLVLAAGVAIFVL